MKLEGLIERLEYTLLQGSIEINVKDIQHNSKAVTEGSLFVCLQGYKKDGHSYIGEAIENGAAAVIITKSVKVNEPGISIIQVEDAREALACIAGKYFNYPSSQFSLVGVTGSKGKTITAVLIDRILQNAGKKTGVINGFGAKIINKPVQLKKIVPSALKLQELFYDMKEANVNNVVMEVHASDLDMRRMNGVEFDVAVFTYLTEEGIDVLETRDGHRKAKLRLFEIAKNAVINIDSDDGLFLIENSTQEKLLTYSVAKSEADLYATEVVTAENQTSFDLYYKNVKYSIVIAAKVNEFLYCILAAVGAALELGIAIDKIIATLELEDLFAKDLELEVLIGEN